MTSQPNTEPYSGKPVEDGPHYSSSIQEVTVKIVDGYRNFQDMNSRNLTVDNLYTSIPLAEKLLDRKVTLVGTVTHNRKGIPSEIKSLTRFLGVWMGSSSSSGDAPHEEKEGQGQVEQSLAIYN